MKYPDETVSKPIVGKEAKKLNAALQQGSHVANSAAMNTIERIVGRRNSPHFRHQQ